MMGDGDHIYDVVVVGAGISGLYTAKLLYEKNVDVMVLEGRNTIMGRQRTLRDPKYGYCELGAAYVGSQQTKLLQVLRELDLDTYKVDTSHDSLICLKGSSRRYKCGNIPSFFNPMVLLDLNNFIRIFDSYCQQVPVDQPWKASRAKQWDSMTALEFFNKHCWTRGARAVCRLAVLSVFVQEPDNMSLLFLLQTGHMCGGFNAMTAIHNGLQEMKIVNGSGSLCEKLAEPLKGKIQLNSHVVDVKQLVDYVHLTTEAGTVYKARKAVLAIPLPVMSKMTFEPRLPDYMAKYAAIPQNSRCVKTYMYYSEPFWRSQGYNGEGIFEEGWITYSMDDTKPGSNYGVLLGFVNGSNAVEFYKLTKSERCRAICKQYSDQFKSVRFLHSVHYVDKYWADEDELKYSGGLCVLSLPPGVLTSLQRLPGDRHGNVHFAGTETALTFRAYMDGALRAGERAAIEVLDDLGVSTNDLDRQQIEKISPVKALALEKYLPSIPELIFLTVTLVIAIVVGGASIFND